MPTVDLPTGIIHYTESGRGVPLVLLHANPGDSLDFDAVVPSLADHYRVIALDWPGYGRSPPPAPPEMASAAFFYEVLCHFLDRMALPPALFVGNSVGGNAAARLACELPESVLGMVLVSPGGFTPHNIVTRMFCRFQGSRFGLPPGLMAALYLRHRTETVDAMLERAETLHASPDSLSVNRAVWRSFVAPDHDLRKVAGAIKAPALLLFGKYDPLIPAWRDGGVAERRIPGAQLKVLPTGHCPFAEVPAMFLSEVLPFLARCTNRIPAGSGAGHRRLPK